MFRFLVFLWFCHFSVATVIRGRVILGQDDSQEFPISPKAELLLSLERLNPDGTSEPISDGMTIQNLTTFPIMFQFAYTSNHPVTSQMKVLARIKKQPYFLYVGDAVITLSGKVDESVSVDIPVVPVRGRRSARQIGENLKRLAWPELVGKQGTFVVDYIKQSTGLTNVVMVPEGSMVTMDFRFDRVRVFVNEQGVVTKTPRTG